VLVDAERVRLTPSHAVKKGQRYRYYVSGALITEAGTDRPQGWRLPAQEMEDAVIRILADALTSPAMPVERFGTADAPSDQTRKMLDSCKPPCRGPQALPSGTSQGRSRPHREGP
jgi:hypothetical protein